MANIKRPSQLIFIQECLVQISFCALRPAFAPDFGGAAGTFTYWHDNLTIGKELYFVSGDGRLMPAKKDQAPPDLSYFKQTQE